MVSRIRIGNDIAVRFWVYRNQIAEDIAAATITSVKVILFPTTETELTIADINTQANPISFTVKGASQKRVGRYKAIIEYLLPNGELHTVDAYAFDLVEHSSDQRLGRCTAAVDSVTIKGNVITYKDIGGIPEAPFDGETYGRNNGAWKKVPAGSGGGADGESAYEIAVDNGFVGTEQEWLASLEGEPGAPGSDGQNGSTPYIGENGNWWIDGEDTGKPSRGEPGSGGSGSGSTPEIGANGNWWIDGVDTGKPSRGEPGSAGVDGEDGAPGTDGADGKSAYAAAVEAGYTGDEAQFATDLSEVGEKAPREDVDAANARIDEAEGLLAGVESRVDDLTERVTILEGGTADVSTVALTKVEMYKNASRSYLTGVMETNATFNTTPLFRIADQRELYVTKDGRNISGVRFVYYDENWNRIGSASSTTGKVVPLSGAVFVGLNFSTTTYPEATYNTIRLGGIIYTPPESISGAIVNRANVFNNIARGGIQYDENSVFCMRGASFAANDATDKNTWFEQGCAALGVTALNMAVGSTFLETFAKALFAGTAWTAEQFEQIDVLCIMFTHDEDVFSEANLKRRYSDYTTMTFTSSVIGRHAVYLDYIIKKYTADCYELRNNPESKWYGTPHGKPVQIIPFTHWHDARTLYNDTIRKVCAKWRLPLVTFDECIGFSKDAPLADGTQVSLIYSRLPSQVVDGVEYGWHPLTTTDSFIQRKMAAIFVNQIKSV